MSVINALRRRFSPAPVHQDWPGLIEAYRQWLPVTSSDSSGHPEQGATPLIPVPSVAERIGRDVKVYVKYDGLNPRDPSRIGA